MKKETLKEASDNYQKSTHTKNYIEKIAFEEGAKWQEERMYSEEEVIEILANFRGENPRHIEQWFEYYKKKQQ